VLDVAHKMAAAVTKEQIEPEITGKYRVGDIRHCFADIGLARRVLGYEPRISFDKGLSELVAWLEGQAATDSAEQARAELDVRGLAL
jgi:dTDP-L-rhamnose 4-epimerase